MWHIKPAEWQCDLCKETLYYRDEVVVLDFNGEDALPEEFGGSGDVYGTVCTTCYTNPEHTQAIQNMLNGKPKQSD